jgi:pyruvate dehydrogenase E2 component (dihydrolipoamide acetyltransferase)
MRQVIAQRLTESKQTIPHFYLEKQVKMDNLIKFRKRIIEETQQKLSVTDFLIKAAAKACKEVPETNS